MAKKNNNQVSAIAMRNEITLMISTDTTVNNAVYHNE